MAKWTNDNFKHNINMAAWNTRQPLLNDAKIYNGCMLYENAYLSLQFSFRFKGTFIILFICKTDFVCLFLLDNLA